MVFVDTNILVYLSTPESEFHKDALKRVQAVRNMRDEFAISNQILREYMVVKTRSIGVPESKLLDEVVTAVNSYRSSFQVFEETSASFEHLTRMVNQYNLRGKIIHDANIAAVMLAHGVTQIFTNNGADFERFGADGIEVIPLSQSA
jgi:predicted nucleic acid-binding protein